jgi:hypothetical protein
MIELPQGVPETNARFERVAALVEGFETRDVPQHQGCAPSVSA